MEKLSTEAKERLSRIMAHPDKHGSDLENTTDVKFKF